MQFNDHRQDRLRALAHYVIWRSNPADLGSTKLNKVLWYSDVEAYRTLGFSVTGATSYEKRQFGPVPHNIYDALGSLQTSGKISASTENHFGMPKKMFMAIERPDLSNFTADQIAIVDMVAESICKNHTAASISQASHDALWEEVPIGGSIPIGAAAVIVCESTADDIAWAAQAFSQM